MMLQILYPDSAGAMRSITMVDLEAKHGSKAVPTDHPVETGATVTDHIRLEHETVTLRGFVSNSLIDAMPDHMDGATATTLTLGDKGQTFAVAGLTRRVDRVQLVFDALRELQASRQPCTVVTGRRRYESMILLDIVWPETASDGAEVTIEARQLRIVTTRTAQVSRPRFTRGHRDNDGGDQAPQTPDPAPSAPRPERSTLLSIGAWLAGG